MNVDRVDAGRDLGNDVNVVIEIPMHADPIKYVSLSFGARRMGMRHALLFLLFMLPSASFADSCTARSGPTTAALLELYTSEGCDSCPPADRWLSSFASPVSVVPVAFHVDYWDYLGWKDAYGDARHSQRQREMARVAGGRAVYTPQVVLAGRDFPGWRSAQSVSRTFEAINAKPARAALEIATSPKASARVSASLLAGQRADNVAVFIAITQNALVSEVKAGENRGATLRHDFVVRDLRVARNWIGSGRVPSLTTQADFSPRPDWKLENMNIVAFVQNVETGEVLQALSAALCR